MYPPSKVEIKSQIQTLSLKIDAVFLSTVCFHIFSPWDEILLLSTWGSRFFPPAGQRNFLITGMRRHWAPLPLPPKLGHSSTWEVNHRFGRTARKWQPDTSSEMSGSARRRWTLITCPDILLRSYSSYVSWPSCFSLKLNNLFPRLCLFVWIWCYILKCSYCLSGIFTVSPEISMCACIVHCIAGDLWGMMYTQSMAVTPQSALTLVI